MTSIRQRAASARVGRLAIASVVLLAVSGLALLEAHSKRRTSADRGHDQLIERDLANGELAQVLGDSALIAQRAAPAQRSEALDAIHGRSVRAERRIQGANGELDAVMDRARTERVMARILDWFGYAGIVLVALLWAAHAILRLWIGR